jgi:hypothetical protein
MGTHDKDCEMYSEACGCDSRAFYRSLMQKSFEVQLFKLQPHDVVGTLFEYFGMALSTAPNEKIDEFFVHFRSGVIDAIRDMKSST